jgi:hypothetical protein
MRGVSVFEKLPETVIGDKQAAFFAGVGFRTLYRHRQAGKLPFRRGHGGLIHYRGADLLEWRSRHFGRKNA